MARPEVTGKKFSADKERATPRLALSISEFCEAHGISVGMFYKMKKQGRTPREMKCGTRTLITFEAAADWRREQEACGRCKEPAPQPAKKSKPVPAAPRANTHP